MYCVVHNTQMNFLGEYLRKRREELRSKDRRFSLRQVASRIQIEPSYLSKIERGELPPPGEQVIGKLAEDLGLDGDVLLALAGKVSSELQAVILKRPELFGSLLRELKNAPDDAVLKIVREVRDGEW